MLDINNVTIRYPRRDSSRPVISSLDLNVERGDYLAILGANGSGKSTLIKAICGMIEIEAGEILFDGTRIRPGRFGEDLFGKIGVVFQEPGGQFLMPDVETEIKAALQNLGLSIDKQNERLREIVDRFSLNAILKHKPESLFGGQMQIVNLACAAATSPQLLLFDEPTTFLDTHYRKTLLEYIDQLWKSGLTIIHVTQYPDEALRAKKAAIIDSGKIVASGEPESILEDEKSLKEYRLAMPRRLACRKLLGFDYAIDGAVESFCSRISAKNPVDISINPNVNNKSDCVLKTEKIRFSYPSGDFNITIDELKLYKNQIAGLVGPAGSGKSTLAFVLSGLLRPDDGEILIDDISLSNYDGYRIREKIGIGWQMPDSVLFGPTVADDLISISENLKLPDFNLKGVLARAHLTGYEDRIVDSLSGGEKRKVALAGALAANPDLIILDEPSAFLDPVSQKELAGIIRDLATIGKALLVIGHDLPFMADVCDRILGMRDGRITFDMPSNKFFSETSYLQSLRLPNEPLINLRQDLSRKGMAFEKSAIDPEYIASRLAAEVEVEGKSLDNQLSDA